MGSPIKLPVEVLEVICHTVDVKSIIMKPLDYFPKFLPGQFLHLAIDEYNPSFNWPESRIFSIANSPLRKNKIKITFSIKGKFTLRMYNEIKKGAILWLKLPYGEFNISPSDDEIILIAGGTGITPFISYLEFAIDNKIKSNITLHYAVRNLNYLIFNSLIEDCKDSLDNFNLNIYINRQSIKQGNKKLFTVETILSLIKNKNNSSFYISGPIKMIKEFSEQLIMNDVAESKIKIDAWE